MRLHLAKQSDTDMMPPYVVGKLQQELPNQYVLSHLLEPVEDPEAEGGFVIEERKTFDVINRTYVWRVEMLGRKPEIVGAQPYGGYGGGLG